MTCKHEIVSETPFQHRMAELRARLEREFPGFARAYDRFIADLRSKGVAENALKAGDQIPPFALPNAEGRLVSSDILLAEGPIVLSFYRGSWCMFCNSFLDELVADSDKITKAGGRIVCMTGETGGRALKAKRAHAAQFEILCDADLGVALSFGLVFPLPDELKQLNLRRARSFQTIYGNDSWFLPLTATYIVERTGRIAVADVDPEFRRRMDPSDMISALEALRDETGSR